jgi:hypothetical protein
MHVATELRPDHAADPLVGPHSFCTTATLPSSPCTLSPALMTNYRKLLACPRGLIPSHYAPSLRDPHQLATTLHRTVGYRTIIAATVKYTWTASRASDKAKLRLIFLATQPQLSCQSRFQALIKHRAAQDSQESKCNPEPTPIARHLRLESTHGEGPQQKHPGLHRTLHLPPAWAPTMLPK